MCGLTVRPRSTAFFASRPAASSTPGFEVLVQEVIAAISTSPVADVDAVVGLEALVQVFGLLGEAVVRDRLRRTAR